MVGQMLDRLDYSSLTLCFRVIVIDVAGPSNGTFAPQLPREACVGEIQSYQVPWHYVDPFGVVI
jgi:hypothetical protein